MNSRRSSVMIDSPACSGCAARLCKVSGKLFELHVAESARKLMHHGRRTRARFEILELLEKGIAVSRTDGRDRARLAALRAVAVGARHRHAADALGVLRVNGDRTGKCQ